MQVLTLVFLTVFSQALPGGARRHANAGNERYEEASYEEARSRYLDGLVAAGSREGPDKLAYGLQNNLGATLHRMEDFAEARDAFARATQHSPSPEDYARAAYNAGNAAFGAQNLEEALSHYREALLRNPQNEDARYNYEFVKRRLEQNQEEERERSDQNEEQEEDPSGGQDQRQDQEQQDEPSDSGQEQDSQPGEEEQRGDEDVPQQGQPDPSETRELTREQAERILQALGEEEQKLLREVQKVNGRPRRVAKDW